MIPASHEQSPSLAYSLHPARAGAGHLGLMPAWLQGAEPTADIGHATELRPEIHMTDTPALLWEDCDRDMAS